jgi:hypothetical protein
VLSLLLLRVLLPALLLAAGPALADCQLLEAGRLPVTVLNGKPYTNGTMSGEPLRLLINTATPHTSVDMATARRTGKAERLQKQVAALRDKQPLPTFEGQPQHLEIGSVKLHDSAVQINTQQNFSGFNGEIGWDLLRLADVDIDLRNGRITYYKPQGACEESLAHWNPAADFVPMYGREGRIAFKVIVDGKSMNAMVSSADKHSYLLWHSAGRIHVTEDTLGVIPLPGHSKNTAGTRTETSAYRFKSFQIGEETIRNPVLMLVRLPDRDERRVRSDTLENKDIDMILGADFLSAHHVYVSYRQRRVYFTYEGGEVFSKDLLPN